ncbi:trigger factor [Schinkia azotoformans MEV2011]|uniref:Trigger factor n=1 Tax=Schinkia azotoformans MEV2011 TaxID=1348973 RepID=A0A072NPW0_SCHAZ|nr:trigger factor [Schinkia azotoformans]KEF39506.1 trigger factor [Schinkia azotoformans MEV2011]MEC1694197.1 trigger factor [Schinkia azotoformans]MEC1715016.1 trigger factor [Schinkia azotoformans]MEC1723589.1 trigger factor [Schinkia azotoformans]MEC1740250.1 trigger factor [Schinkia azotoformans]
MSAKWEKLEGNQGVLTIEVDAETVSQALDTAFKKVVNKVNVPGFRKGKVPRKMFEQRFGVESLYQDALDVMLPEAYGKAVEETGIEPVDYPEIDVQQMEKGKSMIFTATVIVKPEVQLGEYKGLEVEEQDTTVTDEDVEAELKSLQEKNAELVVKEEGEVVNGDTVVIDFEGFVDGEAFDGGQADNYSLTIGSGQFIPGFEDQIVGMKAGEEKDVNVSFPEEYHAPELAGKPAVFKVNLHEIKYKELPELDDEFAKDVDDEVETLDELKAKLKEKLQGDKEHQAKHAKEDAVIGKAVENATVDIPEAMIKSETDRMMKEFEQRLQMQGLNLELYFQFSGQDESALREQMKTDAEGRVKTNLVLEAIVAAENIEVTDADIEAEYENIGKMYNMPAEEVKKMLGSNNYVAEDLKMKKAIDFLVENSKVSA